MSTNAQIKQFTVADTDSLLAFLREVYPDDPRKSEPIYWKWHYLENPYTRLDDVPLWVLHDEGRIVGQVATIPVALKVGAREERRAIWILDFIVHENYRGQRWGRRLLDTAREHCRTMIALGINAGSTGVLNSQKWTAMGSIRRYHLLLYPGHAVKELAGRPALGRVVNFAYTPLRPRRTSKRSFDENGVTVRAVERFDADFDDLWRRASPQWPCAVVRRADYLNWQFARQPGKRYETLAMYAGGQLAGYVVLFFRKPEASDEGGASPKVAISDLCYDAGAGFDVIDKLLRAALDLALERRAGSLVTDVLDARVEERLVRLGFWRIKRAPGFMVYSETERELMNDPRNWFLTRADSDVSIFEHPNL